MTVQSLTAKVAGLSSWSTVRLCGWVDLAWTNGPEIWESPDSGVWLTISSHKCCSVIKHNLQWVEWYQGVRCPPLKQADLLRFMVWEVWDPHGVLMVCVCFYCMHAWILTSAWLHALSWEPPCMLYMWGNLWRRQSAIKVIVTDLKPNRRMGHWEYGSHQLHTEQPHFIGVTKLQAPARCQHQKSSCPDTRVTVSLPTHESLHHSWHTSHCVTPDTRVIVSLPTHESLCHSRQYCRKVPGYKLQADEAAQTAAPHISWREPWFQRYGAWQFTLGVCALHAGIRPISCRRNMSTIILE